MEGWSKLLDNPPTFESLPTIKVPVLIIDGDKDLPYSYFREISRKSNPGMIKGVAHMLNLEKPGDVNRLIEEFLKKDE